MEKMFTFAAGKSPATSSLQILQDGNVAKVEGCSGATGVACPLFKTFTFIFLKIKMYKIKRILHVYQFFMALIFLISCEGNQSNVDNVTIISTRRAKVDNSQNNRWNNPMLTPYGKDLVSIIRGYFLVGEFDKMIDLLILPNGYNKDQLKVLLRKSSWGYELKVMNLKWEKDSSFQLAIRTNIHNTSGVEYYEGRIVNDTAKLIVYPERKRIFVK